MYSVILIPLLFLAGLSSVHSVSLDVTCSQDATKDLKMSVSLLSGAITQYAKIFIADEANSKVDITASTPDPIDFTGRSFDSTYTFIMMADNNVEVLSDINESWECTRNLTAVNVESSNEQIQTSSDGSSSSQVTSGFTVDVTDVTGAAFSGAQTIGTAAKLTISQNVNYQDDFWFHVEGVEAKVDSETSYIALYNTTSKCSLNTNLMGNPSVKTSQVTITINFILFRLFTADLSSGTQEIVYKVTVIPCEDQASCQSAACEDSPDPTRRRRRRSAIDGEESNIPAPVDLFARAAVLPSAATGSTSKTTGGDDNDSVLEDGLCFGRAPVYAGAAILVALLISLMCFGFLFVALKRRFNKDRLVEYPSPSQSVASVHGVITNGKSSIRG